MDANALQVNTLYLTLNKLDPMPDKHCRFHWGLFLCKQITPTISGIFYHATDAPKPGEASRNALDLYYERRNNANPTRSQRCIACFKIASVSDSNAFDTSVQMIVGDVPLMRPPVPGSPEETRWTCRVWVKEVLRRLHEPGQRITLPVDVNTIEKQCEHFAINFVNNRRQGQARYLANSLDWMTAMQTDPGTGSASGARPPAAPAATPAAARPNPNQQTPRPNPQAGRPNQQAGRATPATPMSGIEAAPPNPNRARLPAPAPGPGQRR